MPVVPVGIGGTRLMFSKEQFFPQVTICFGEPIAEPAPDPANGQKAPDIGVSVMQAIQKLIR